VSVKAPSLSNVTLNAATAVQQNITELSEAVSQKDKIMVIAKMLLNLMKQNGC
jgi:hypothetical protein